MTSRELVIDSCCVLNLLATGREVEIVRALGVCLFDTPFTSGEPTMLWTHPDREGRRMRQPASAAALRSHGLLDTRPLDTDDLRRAFVLAGALIPAPDASCIALAGVLGIPLVTEDRKQRRVASELFPRIELVSTLDILHEASRALDWDDDLLASAAADLRWRGNFAPPRNDPRNAWFAELLRRAGAEG